ncbi:ricin-type beta-trefoil lectin domain protein [Allokutzneria sp. A3M-2-11 16]|uniref:RICIN domain-containing protein n=1 Tax=Allokutzneria sp. A3M-2-11 16 TaxID=2962043 RepID=UPI0020B6C554|nr:ricin-type beta-trefoil lectin domain protein [Allokutzneria sp. A3M-2-11 16]MCP3802145.1 ricin-type beta-trefoil lectin domain protein [Allokutzneria sp. A3M-2-11 16]
MRIRIRGLGRLALLGVVLVLVNALGTVVPAAAASGSDLRTRVNENKCADIYKFDNSNGAKVVIWDCNGLANQKWIGVGHGEIRSIWNNKCLTFVRDVGRDSGRVLMFDCTGDINQLWTGSDTEEVLCPKALPRSCLILAGGITSNGWTITTWPRDYPPKLVHRWYFA